MNYKNFLLEEQNDEHHSQLVELALNSLKESKLNLNNESTHQKDPQTIQKLRKIVDTRKNAKIDGQMVDLFTASAIIQLYDAINDVNKEKLTALNIPKMSDVAFKFISRMKKEDVNLDEAKSGTGYDLYHKDFSSAMAHAYDFAKRKYGIEVDPEEIMQHVALGPKKPSSGKTNMYRLKDVTGKKAIQIQVANLDNKRYELNMYTESLGAKKSLQKAHDRLRKKSGLPDPSYYLKLMAKKQKEIDDMYKEIEDEKRMKKERYELEKEIFSQLDKNMNVLGIYEARKRSQPNHEKEFEMMYTDIEKQHYVMKHPDAYRLLKNPDWMFELRFFRKHGIKHIPNPSDNVLIEYLHANPLKLQDIKNPSEKVQLAAVKFMGAYLIQYIKNPSTDVQLAAVNKNGNVLKYIKNPSTDVQLAAVNNNGEAIQYIRNPSEKFQLAAVNNYGGNIYHINNPSENVQLAAVNNYPFAIEHINNPSENVQLAAVNKDKRAIRYIKNRTPKVIALAFD